VPTWKGFISGTRAAEGSRSLTDPHHAALPLVSALSGPAISSGAPARRGSRCPVLQAIEPLRTARRRADAPSVNCVLSGMMVTISEEQTRSRVGVGDVAYMERCLIFGSGILRAERADQGGST
jgi:hypothetical protein